MATIHFEVQVTDAAGNLVSKIPSTAKAFANKIGKTRAKETGGKFEVKPVAPREYNGEDW